MKKPIKHARYSKQAVAAGCGTAFWRRIDGKIVEVTTVCDNIYDPNYLWPDREYVGQVTEFVRVGQQRPRNPFQERRMWAGERL